MAEASNLLLLGPPGVGKTHLAVALALKSMENGYGAYFVRAYDLMEDLRKARAEGSIILTSNKGFANWGELLATRRYWTGCCTTATSSTSAARVTG